MRHDIALCETILARQLLAGNWCDLHANGVRLLKDAAGCAEVKEGDVHTQIVQRCPLLSTRYR